MNSRKCQSQLPGPWCLPLEFASRDDMHVLPASGAPGAYRMGVDAPQTVMSAIAMIHRPCGYSMVYGGLLEQHFRWHASRPALQSAVKCCWVFFMLVRLACECPVTSCSPNGAGSR